jgi:type IV pilus assembly protein PilA
MLTTIKQRLGRDDEQGFTLIELMVVVLIIAILLAIAIPTFLGARNTANARGAQSNLRNALTAEQTQWTNGQAFDATTTDMQSVEPALHWEISAPATADAPQSVAVVIGSTTDAVFLQALGKDKNCYTIYQSNAATASSTVTGYNVTPSASGACGLPVPATSTPASITAGSAAQHAGAAGAPSATGFYTNW